MVKARHRTGLARRRHTREPLLFSSAIDSHVRTPPPHPYAIWTWGAPSGRPLVSATDRRPHAGITGRSPAPRGSRSTQKGAKPVFVCEGEWPGRFSGGPPRPPSFRLSSATAKANAKQQLERLANGFELSRRDEPPSPRNFTRAGSTNLWAWDVAQRTCGPFGESVLPLAPVIPEGPPRRQP